MKKKILFGIDLTDIRNLNEVLVVELLKKTLDKSKTICRCNDCIEDMYALSLIRLEPQYHPNHLVERYSENYSVSQKTHMKKAKTVVKEAIDIIKKNPHHCEDETEIPLSKAGQN
jgi:competence protein ComFB